MPKPNASCMKCFLPATKNSVDTRPNCFLKLKKRPVADSSNPKQPVQTVALGIEYAGQNYFGWQTQPEGNTVQDVLEGALCRFLTVPVATICAGRTDRGVHATHQVVSIASPFRRAPASWIRGVNTFLPDDIAVKWACEVPEGFHARFDALSRTYQYWIFNHPVRSPVMHGKTGWVWRPLDAEKMHEAAQILVGEHDFSSFRAAECQAATPVRTVKHITVRRQGALIGVEISANAFLQHMVRNIVGSLIYVGTGRESVQWLADVLHAKSRAVAAPTFDPLGLYLTGVEYPSQLELPVGGLSPFVF